MEVDPGAFDLLPGNNVCVWCNLGYALAAIAVEIPVLYFITAYLASKQRQSSPTLQIRVHNSHLELPGRTAHDDASGGNNGHDGVVGIDGVGIDGACLLEQSGSLSTVLQLLGWILAVLGWLYWAAYWAVYWNFVSYLLLIGPALVVPPILVSYRRSNPGPERCKLVARRVKLGGWVIGLLMLVLFQNVALVPQQLYRHWDKSGSTITPNHPLVQQFKDQFLQQNLNYGDLTFVQQMQAVDTFIFNNIVWKEDMDLYHMVGLLTSPEDVLTRMAGDCQGQAVTTTSLLFALGGVQAYCVETPFHWWTHAVSNTTGETYDLNAHGSSGVYGSVTPQPVDMMYTWYPARCEVGVDGCLDVDAHNMDTVTYVAPPPRALAIALTAMHEFRRDFAPIFDNGKQALLLLVGAGVAVGVALYATYFQADCCTNSGFLKRVLLRVIVAAPASVFAAVMMYVWSYLFYPVVLVHLIGTVVFAFVFTSSDGYNRSIGTPAYAVAHDQDVAYAPVALA